MRFRLVQASSGMLRERVGRIELLATMARWIPRVLRKTCTCPSFPRILHASAAAQQELKLEQSLQSLSVDRAEGSGAAWFSGTNTKCTTSEMKILLPVVAEMPTADAPGSRSAGDRPGVQRVGVVRNLNSQGLPNSQRGHRDSFSTDKPIRGGTVRSIHA